MQTRLAVALMVVANLWVASPMRAQEAAGSLTDLTGVWVMEVEGHQMALELDQKADSVEGVLESMGRRILLVGTYRDRELWLKGERPEDGAGFSHGGAKSEGGPVVATMQDDGTLVGELSTNRGRTKWTGTRFRKP
jgi:hypothetical protein